MVLKALQWVYLPGSCDECSTAPGGCWQSQSAWAQTESWYSFYHPTEGRRL